MITYAPSMEANLRDPAWRARQRAGTATMASYQQSQSPTRFAPLGPMQQAFRQGPQAMTAEQMSPRPAPAMPPVATRALVAPPPPSAYVPNWRPWRAPVSTALQVSPRGLVPTMPPAAWTQAEVLGPRALSGPASAVARGAGAAMSLPAQALLGLGMAGWEYGAPKAGMGQGDYTYDAMGNITGLANQDTPVSTMPMDTAPTPAVYSGDVGMMARHAIPMQAPAYSPAVAAQIAQRRAAMGSPSITDRLNRESQIRETVTPMSIDPRLDSSYNPDDLYGY